MGGTHPNLSTNHSKEWPAMCAGTWPTTDHTLVGTQHHVCGTTRCVLFGWAVDAPGMRGS